MTKDQKCSHFNLALREICGKDFVSYDVTPDILKCEDGHVILSKDLPLVISKEPK